MDNQIVEWMKEVVNLCDERQGYLKYAGQEVNMWRERFLSTLPKGDDVKKEAKLWSCFLYTPSKEFSTCSPEKHIENIKRMIDESQ